MDSLSSHTQIICTELNGVTAKDFFLKNPNLVTQTFSHLQVENDKEYRLCLFNAALTCKDFLDAALDALWENLDSLVPLLRILPALHVEDEAYVLSGSVSQADWNRLEYYARRVKFFQAMPSDTKRPQVVLSTYFRIAQLQSSFLLPSLRHLRCSLEAGSTSHVFLFLSPSLESLEFTNIAGSENNFVRPFLDTLPSPMLNQIVLRTGRLSVDALNFISQFKQLRSLELSDAAFMNNIVLRDVIGVLPSLANLTLKAISSQTEAHRAYVSEESNNESGGPERFNALENLRVTGSLLLIRDLLNFVQSPCLKSIEVHPAIDWKLRDNEARRRRVQSEPDDDLAQSIAMVSSKWPQSLENLVIGQHNIGHSKPPKLGHRSIFPNFTIVPLMDLHEMQTFHVKNWKIGSTTMDDDVRRLVISWPKLTTLILPVDQMPISLSTLRIIAENCSGLRYLQTHLDVSTIPPFNAASAALCHKLGVLSVASSLEPSTSTTLQSQICLARHLDSMFPYLESIETHVGFNADCWSKIYELVKLCQGVRQDEAERQK